MMDVVPPFVDHRVRETSLKNKEVQQVIHDTYSTLSDIVSSSAGQDGSCGHYALCLNVQHSIARYGLEILNSVVWQQRLWKYIIKPILRNGDCSSLFPECVE